jgi:hypothetical protein
MTNYLVLLLPLGDTNYIDGNLYLLQLVIYEKANIV